MKRWKGSYWILSSFVAFWVSGPNHFFLDSDDGLLRFNRFSLVDTDLLSLLGPVPKFDHNPLLILLTICD